jgi:hypothetical protein
MRLEDLMLTVCAPERREEMKCPNCGLINPDTAERCDCGYDFQSGEIREPYSRTPAPAGGTWKGPSVLSIIVFVLSQRLLGPQVGAVGAFLIGMFLATCVSGVGGVFSGGSRQASG